jgi:S1-C subfamily serine protease
MTMSEALAQISEGLAAAVARAGDQVVRVEGRRRLPASGIIWSADGLILTAHHVLERERDVHVGLPGGERLAAEVVGRDPTTDLALLRIKVDGLPAAEWAEVDGLSAGHLAIALGRPGESINATLGIISALSGAWRSPAGGEIDHYLQTDVVMYPGFSGGALIQVDGRPIGLSTSALLRGISLAIPAATLRKVTESLKQHGRVRRGFLGVTAQPARLPAAIAEQLGRESGLLLGSIESDGPAEQAGLVLGDTIVAMDGKGITGLDDLLSRLSSEAVGQERVLDIVRGGELRQVVVVVGERP